MKNGPMGEASDSSACRKNETSSPLESSYTVARCKTGLRTYVSVCLPSSSFSQDDQHNRTSGCPQCWGTSRTEMYISLEQARKERLPRKAAVLRTAPKRIVTQGLKKTVRTRQSDDWTASSQSQRFAIVPT